MPVFWFTCSLQETIYLKKHYVSYWLYVFNGDKQDKLSISYVKWGNQGTLSHHAWSCNLYTL